MNEQLPNNPDYLQHHPDAVQDIDAAHDLAKRVDPLESTRAALIGGMAVLGNEYASGERSDPLSRSASGERAAMDRLAKANGVHETDFDDVHDTFRDQHDKLSPLFGEDTLHQKVHGSSEYQTARAANHIEDKWRDAHHPDSRNSLSFPEIESHEDLQAAAAVAKEEIGEIDEELNELYAGGLTPQEKEVQQRQQEANAIVADVAKR